jgi:hypothetical protein
MSALIRALLVVIVATASAFADGDARVVLADKDPELLRAIRATLAPWHMEVSVDEIDTRLLTTRADARFVVWRENGELVVFDRDRKETERREAPTGALDPVSAAAAALTVKTLMRLPPIVDEAPPIIEAPLDIHMAPVNRTPPTTLGVQAGAGARRSSGGMGGVASLGVFVKPPLPLRLGIAGEYAAAIDADGSGGFKGTWHDWNALGIVGWALALTPRWEVEPHVGMGVRRFVLDGRENMMAERHERETLFMVRGGVFVRARFGHFHIGASAAADVSIGTPTYTKQGTASEVFSVPPFALAIGMFAGADL